MPSLDAELEHRFARQRWLQGEDVYRRYLADLEARNLGELHRLLGADQSDERRAMACAVLGRIGDRRSSVPRLLATLQSTPNHGLQIEAAVALGQLGGKRMTRELSRVVFEHPDAHVRAMAAYALGFGGDEEVAPALASVVADEHEDADVRCHAAEAIGHLFHGDGPRPVVDVLVRALSDASANVRFWAAFALGQAGTSADIPALEPLRSDTAEVPGWWSVAKEAADAIEWIRGREADDDEDHRGLP